MAFSRDELVEIVRAIQAEFEDPRLSEAAEAKLIASFVSSVPHPQATRLLIRPEIDFGPEYRDRNPAPEAVVDRALSYKGKGLSM